jgi:hypothetical protein
MGVPGVYVQILSKLYQNQTGEVITDKTSKRFKIQRGTKQGDPLSPKLFNAVLEDILRLLQPKWRSRGWGVNLGEREEDKLCNLRFADDLLLMSTSRAHLEVMLRDLENAARNVGLEIHMGKTKILSNLEDELRKGPNYIQIAGHRVDILKHTEMTKYLGRALTFGDLHDVEIQHRINCGWAKFHYFRKELCCKHYPLSDRLRLFEATVTPSVLYGCGAWTMTKDREHTLRVAQRRMLRKIVQVARRRIEKSCSSSSDSDASDAELSRASDDLEDWVDWIKRATVTAEGAARRSRVTDWVEEQAKRKFLWAGHVARREDGRWNAKLLHWWPTACRRRGHPRRRWSDVLDAYFWERLHLSRGECVIYAGDRVAWASLVDDFIKFASTWTGKSDKSLMEVGGKASSASCLLGPIQGPSPHARKRAP